MGSGWIMWVAVLVVWPLVGLIVAYLFGEILRAAGPAEDAAVPPRVSYLRRQKRVSRPLRASTENRIGRVAGARRRWGGS